MKDSILLRGEQSNLYAYVDNDPVNFVDPEGKRINGEKFAACMLDAEGPNAFATSELIIACFRLPLGPVRNSCIAAVVSCKQ